MDRIKARLKRIRGAGVIYLSRKLLAAAAFAAAAAIMFWVVNNPAVVGASATTRQLPIYCVQKDYKVLSLSFDAAWGDVILRQAPASSQGGAKCTKAPRAGA